MIRNSMTDLINTACLVGTAGYLGKEIAKRLNLTQVWEHNVPLNLQDDPRVIQSKMEINLLTGKITLDILKQVPIMNETIVATVGAIFGAAIGFAGDILIHYLEKNQEPK